MMEATVTPKYVKQGDRYVLGVGPQAIERRSYGPGEAFKAGLASAWSSTRNIVVTLKRVITGRDDLRESLGGPVMIAKVTSEAAARGPTVFWRIVAILSVTLAIMNILPIPALDGGQLLFLLYEAVTRRRPSVRVRLVAQQIGMILLLGFMAFLIFNDILRL
jgi:regulator of sigma E protease